MRKYQLIEHTADIGLVAYGQDLAQAFGNAAQGLFSIITDLRKVKKIDSKTVEIREKSPEDLLFAWLNHLIFLFDAEQLLLKQCDVKELDAYHIKSICHGEKVDPSRHEIKLGVKAATYHMLKVDPENNRVQVIFDI